MGKQITLFVLAVIYGLIFTLIWQSWQIGLILFFITWAYISLIEHRSRGES